VKLDVRVAVSVPFVTETFFAPSVPLGVLKVTVVAVFESGFTAIPPTETEVTLARVVPFIVTVVPPVVGPTTVFKEEMAGAGGLVTVI
jgi:hypothetical protein